LDAVARDRKEMRMRTGREAVTPWRMRGIGGLGEGDGGVRNVKAIKDEVGLNHNARDVLKVVANDVAVGGSAGVVLEVWDVEGGHTVTFSVVCSNHIIQVRVFRTQEFRTVAGQVALWQVIECIVKNGTWCGDIRQWIG
jgi:hypothetical protein